MHLFLLTDSMGSVCRLAVHSRIPIVVIEDNCICGNQVDSKTTSPGGKYEDKHVGVSLELFNHEPTILKLCLPIHAEIGIFSPDQEVFEYVHHFGHLAENQASMVFTVETFKELI